MINMMMDILQYVPYALFLAFIFGVLLTGVLVTLSYFRGYDKNPASNKPVKLIEKYPRFFGTSAR